MSFRLTSIKIVALGFLMMAGLVVMMGVWTVLKISSLADLTDDMHRHPLTVSNSLLEANADIIAMHRHMKDVALSQNPRELELAISEVNTNETKVYEHFDIIKDRFLGDTEQIEEVVETFSQWKAIRAEVIDLVKAGRIQEAAEITKGKGALHVERLNLEMSHLLKFARNKAAEFLASSHSIYKQTFLELLLLMAVLLMTVAGVSFLVVYTVKEGERKRKESEGQFRRAIMYAPVPIMIHADDGNVVAINDMWSTLTGYAHSDIPTISEWTLNAYGKKMDDVKSVIDALFTSDIATHEGEFKVRTKSGRSRVWDFSSGPLGLAPDGKRLVISMATDVTDRKQTDDELRSNAERFNRWKASNFIGIIQSNAKGGVSDANDTILDMLGYSRQELLNGQLDWTKLTPPEFLPLDEKAIAEAADKGYWTAFEKEYFHRDGHRVPIIIGGSIFKESPDEYIVFVIDISERKQAEEELRKFEQIVSSSSDLMALMNKNYIYEAANTAYLKAFAMTSDQLLGRTVIDIHGEEYFDKKVKPNTERCLEGETAHFKSWIHLPSHGERYLDVTYYPYIDSEGAVQGFVLNARDVTEQNKLEGELFNAKKLESVGVLAGGIAHDFNNILTGLFGNIELAEMELTHEHAAYPYIRTANQALERATDLTKQLLTFAKGGDPILEAVNLSRVIQSSTEFNLSGSNIKMDLNLPDKLWWVIADKGQLSQIISNLTINAKQAMPDGGTLYVSAENVSENEKMSIHHLSGDYVKICIRDEGWGIPDKYIEKIFDPYFTTKQAGSGLGLATAHAIIAKHKGHLSVTSKQGIGTTFTLWLPAELSLNEVDEISHSTMIKGSKFATGHVLVMDDEAMIRDLSASMLEPCGYTVDTAADGKEALEKYISTAKTDNPFAIVIMDLTIPGGLGGKDCINELLAIDPAAKCIVSSGYSTDPIVANYTDYGFKGRLVKPFTIKELENELSRVMELS